MICYGAYGAELKIVYCKQSKGDFKYGYNV